jgi:hypothetical protein
MFKLLMRNHLDEIANHLEFFGYTIEKKEREDAANSFNYYARHERHYNIRFFEIYKNNYVCFQICFWHDGLDINTSTLAEAFNEFNRKGIVTKFYYTRDKDGSRVFVYAEAIFIGDYTKQSFGLFYDRFKAEEKDAFESASYKNCFITKEEAVCTVQ